MKRALLLAVCASVASAGASDLKTFKEWTLHKTSNFANTSSAALSSRALLLDRQLKCQNPTMFLCPGGYCCYPQTKLRWAVARILRLLVAVNTVVFLEHHAALQADAAIPESTVVPVWRTAVALWDGRAARKRMDVAHPGRRAVPAPAARQGLRAAATANVTRGTSTTTTTSSTTTCSTINERSLPTSGLRSRATAPAPLYYPNSPEIQDLLANMCIGMRKRGAVQSEELTYLGPSKQYKAEKDQNRRDAGCVGADNDCDFQNGAGDSCDEYPFASTHEGGIDQVRCTRAHKRCIPHVQNSKQGRIFNKYLAQLRKLGQPLKPGDKFTVQIDPSFDCSKVPDNFRRVKRADAPYSGSGTQSTVWQPLGNTSDSKYLIVPLGDVADGQYDIDLKLRSGSVSSITVIDNEGEEYATAGQLTSANAESMQFFLESTTSLGGVGLSAILETDNDDTSVTYDVVGKPLPRLGGDEPPNAALPVRSLEGLWYVIAVATMAII
ncbi:hypothetical protein AURDEDRAFT_185433 [Auricularia subglabra TFB-10046 SS5]|nr:hypothetical protein AURDEDRAFT_185433 [Auricularia subglabra TFB-10046 SS5]